MRALVCASLLFVTACSSKTGSLAVVTVDSSMELSGVSKLSVLATASGRTLSTSVSTSSPSIPPSQTFGIDLSPDLNGELDVTVSALGSSGDTLAMGTGSVTIVTTERVDLTITLGNARTDLGVDDLSQSDAEEKDDSEIRPPTFTSRNVSPSNSLLAIWGGDASHIWASGEDSISTYFSSGNDVWSQDMENPYYQVNGINGTDSSHGWMVDNNGTVRVLNSTGTDWTGDVSLTGLPNLTAVWAASATDAWTVSNGGNETGGYVYHNVTAGTNTQVAWVNPYHDSTVGFNAVWGAAIDDIYIAGDNGNILRTDDVNTFPTYHYFGTSNLYGIRALDGTHVYVVGADGALGFSIGDGNFTQQTLPAALATTNLRAIWASALDDIYMVGDNGTILHSTGDGTWQQRTSGLEGMSPARTLTAIWGTGPDNIYITSNAGDIVHGK